MISRRSILQSGLALAASGLCASRTLAATTLSGNVTQGALIRGRVASGTKVTFDGKLLKLSAILKSSADQGLAVDTVDLTVNKNVPVTYRTP